MLRRFTIGQDVFVSLPTGYGKSYCFALLPTLALFDYLRSPSHPPDDHTSITVVVSPLTALMMEQRSKFSVKGVSSEFVGELQHDVKAMRGVKSGAFQLVYISPESLLQNPQWRDMVSCF